MENMKMVSLHGKRTIVGGFWNLYIEGTDRFVNLSREQLLKYVPDLGVKQRFCYPELPAEVVADLFSGKEEVAWVG